MEFKNFAQTINTQINKMSKNDKLYRVKLEDKNVLYNLYLSAFPEGTNPIYKEKTEHDCNCCKNFIRDIGNVISLSQENKIETIWDNDLIGTYGIVSKILSDFIKQQPIENIFLHYQSKIGSEKTFQQLENKEIITWNHFYTTIPTKFVETINIDKILGETKTTNDVFTRSLDLITLDSISIVEDLIQQNSIYRGEQFLNNILTFKTLKNKYSTLTNELEKNHFTWLHIDNDQTRIKNAVIGTLLTDISEGYDLDDAVKSYESKVAPTNYKRPTALITQKMIDSAMKTIEELGISESLKRRYAIISDLSVNNVIFTNNDTSILMKDNLKESLISEIKQPEKNYTKIEDITIENFIQKIIPNINAMELLFENKLQNNLMSLIAPVNLNSPNILKWDNNFSWSYNGNITDSITEKVKNAGGNINNFLRISLAWYNTDDLDVHVVEPNNNHIHFGNKNQIHPSTGKLDVDMNAGSNHSTTPVENITWTNPHKLLKGKYTVYVHNFNKRSQDNNGFEIEFKYNDQIKTLTYEKSVKQNENINCFTFEWNGTEVINFKLIDIEDKNISKTIWNIDTEKFHKVNLLTYSPNFWDNQSIGNKHYFFILNKCLNPDTIRGLYNEFIINTLDQHRKVFEVIGNKIKCDYSNEQLSGLGFSSTKKNNLICKVSGNFNRTLKINF